MTRAPKCTCGSGAHPRPCQEHPEAFEEHCKELEELNYCPECKTELSDIETGLRCAFCGYYT